MVITDGGRVLGVARAQEAVEKISLRGGFYRKDIAHRALGKGV